MHVSFFHNACGAHILIQLHSALPYFRAIGESRHVVSCNVFPVAISVGRLNHASIIDPDGVILSGRFFTPSLLVPSSRFGTVCLSSGSLQLIPHSSTFRRPRRRLSMTGAVLAFPIWLC